MKNRKIAIIGCGNLGLSILNGLLRQDNIIASNLTVTKRDISTLDHLSETGINITPDNSEAIRHSDIVILALKPYNILETLKELQPDSFKHQPVLISVATGISIQQIQDTIQLDIPVYRAMPNTAADVSASITCIATSSSDKNTLALVESCFNSIGETVVIDETLMEAATVLGACGIAYVLRFVRGMIQGGIQIGFDSKTATKIATHTVLGASKLLIENNNHPEYEIDKVTTPKGCTIAGLNEMEHNGFSSALIKGIVTSFKGD